METKEVLKNQFEEATQIYFEKLEWYNSLLAMKEEEERIKLEPQDIEEQLKKAFSEVVAVQKLQEEIRKKLSAITWRPGKN